MINCKCSFSYPEGTRKCGFCGQDFSHLYPTTPKATTHRISIAVDGKVVVELSVPQKPQTPEELIDVLREVKEFIASPIVGDISLY